MGYYNKYAYQNKIRQRQAKLSKQTWMRLADDAIAASDDDRKIRSRQDYWDTLTHLFNTENSPSEAAAKMLQLGD